MPIELLQKMIDGSCHPSVSSGYATEWTDSYDWSPWWEWCESHSLPHRPPTTLNWNTWHSWLTHEDWTQWQDWPGWPNWRGWLKRVESEVAGFDYTRALKPMNLQLFCDYHDQDTEDYPTFTLFFTGVAQPDRILSSIRSTRGEILSAKASTKSTQTMLILLEFEHAMNGKEKVEIEHCTSDYIVDAGPFADRAG